MSPQTTLDRPLRVARLITWLPVGGIERRLVAVLPRLQRAGCEVRLFCLRERGALADGLEAAGVPVDVTPMKTRLHPPSLRRLAAALREFAPDVVHSHMYRSNTPGTIAARMAGVPVTFAQIHNVDTWESARQRCVDRFLCRWRDGVICVSEAVQRDVMGNLGLSADRAPVLYNGSDTDQFRPDGEARARLRADLGLREDQVLALVPARLHRQKNPVGVVQAAADAMAKLDGQSPVVAFAGKGPEADAVREAIAARGMDERIRLLGPRDDMAALYNAADLVVLSTFKEGFSNAVVEALATGKPVVAARVGGNAEAIDSPRVGWLHDAGDGAALAAQLAEAMANPERLRDMAGDCRARGMHFSLDRLVGETLNLYAHTLENKRGSTRP